MDIYSNLVSSAVKQSNFQGGQSIHEKAENNATVFQ